LKIAQKGDLREETELSGCGNLCMLWRVDPIREIHRG
jgi:hypothetical protein